MPVESKEDPLEQERKNKRILHSKLQESLKTLPTAKIFYSFIRTALLDVLQYEIGFDAALLEFEVENEDGHFAVDDNRWVRVIRKNFSELIFLDRMVHLTGNSGFRDEILKSYISAMFPQKRVTNPNKGLDNLLKLLKTKT